MKKKLGLLLVVGGILGSVSCSSSDCPTVDAVALCVVVPRSLDGEDGDGGAGGASASGEACPENTTISFSGEDLDVITGTNDAGDCESCTYGAGPGTYDVRVELEGEVDEQEIELVATEDGCGTEPVRYHAFE